MLLMAATEPDMTRVPEESLTAPGAGCWQKRALAKAEDVSRRNEFLIRAPDSRDLLGTFYSKSFTTCCSDVGAF